MTNDDGRTGSDEASDETGRTQRIPEIRERAFAFACRVVHLSRHLDTHSSAGRHLSQQLLRAGTSVGANLEEAHAAQTPRDFVTKVSIALKEARETHYWLRLLAACGITPPERLSALVGEANELVAILTTIRRSAQQNAATGRPKRRSAPGP